MGDDSTERGREERRRQQEEDEVSSSFKRRNPTATAVDIDLEVLDCTICYAPLKPPVFQCALGHVVCSCCRVKLSGDKCHICSVGAAATCYNRCYAVEHILESLQVPCAHAGRGCAAKTAYHDKEAHEASCPHAPCYCPEPGCGFPGGPPSLLLSHLVSLHDWPSSVFRFDEPLEVPVVKHGVRVLRNGGGGRNLFFLLVMRPAEPLGLAVSALCVHPHPHAAAAAARPGFICQLQYYCTAMDGGQLFSDPRVKSTNLSDGIPSDSGSIPLVLPDPSSRLARGGVLTVTVKKAVAPAG